MESGRHRRHAVAWRGGLLAGVLIATFASGVCANPPRAAARIVWGDVHAHTGFSMDGRGDPTAFYLSARDQAGLDFVILTDHDIWLTQAEWTTLMDLADSFNDPGRFVTFVGVEWSHSYHMNVYFRGNEGAICSGEDGGPACARSPEFAAFYGPSLIAGEAVSHVNHPRDHAPWHEIDTAVTPNVEMFNYWWDRLWNAQGVHDNERGFQTILWALQVGRRFGFVGSSDYHGYWWNGPIGTGLTGCHVEQLTREDVFDALRARRCYATDGDRIAVDFDVDGTFMGGETAAPVGSTVTANIAVTAAAVPAAIEVVRNGIVVATKTDCLSTLCGLTAEVPIVDEYTFIYARVRLPTGKRAWATPVWVRGVCTAAADCPPERFMKAIGNSPQECLLRWRVLRSSVRNGRRAVCSDGDPACDAGSTPNECTFRVGICTGVTTGEPTCAAEAVTDTEVERPSIVDAFTNHADLQNLFTMITALRGLGATVPPGQCTPYLDVRVPLTIKGTHARRGTRFLSAKSRNAQHLDRDTIRLVCRPPRT